ncbi:MAG: FHA domain-containing protein [Leptolyngbya sp. Prado105]|nr:FHA domain-containing protein [Leptolyngbya sp. Prado105]
MVTLQPIPHLVLHSDISSNQRLPLVGNSCWTIGRSEDNTFVIRDRWISRNHAMLQWMETGEFYLIDLGSRNGTFVNGRRVSIPVTLQNGAGCDSIVTLTIIQHPIPSTPTINSNSPIACPGDNVTIATTPVTGATYVWTGPNGFTSSNPILNFQASASDSGTYSVTVFVNGCPSATSFTQLEITGWMELPSELFPNVITPNGDNVNDYLDLNTMFTTCVPYTFQLFNRWGNLVYEQDFNSPPFKGEDLNGNELSPGVYFYKLNYMQLEKNGFITILKD